MGPKATALVAGIIDRLENRPHGAGRPPLPTIKVVEALRFFVREGVPWRELRATAGRACGSTLRRRLDGWSATAALKQAPNLAHIPVIALTAHGTVEARRRGAAAGCDGYLEKPIDYERLVRTVARVLPA